MNEEKRNVEILNNIKEYMQNSIDSGHHKFIYNDLDWDEKCVDIINAIDYFIEKVEQQQKEIEEKNCLIDVLQHKIEELLDNKKEINYIKPIDIPVHNYINKDKIKELYEEYKDTGYYEVEQILKELLEEN